MVKIGVTIFYTSSLLVLLLPFFMGYKLKKTPGFGKHEFSFIVAWNIAIVVSMVSVYLLCLYTGIVPDTKMIKTVSAIFYTSLFLILLYPFFMRYQLEEIIKSGEITKSGEIIKFGKRARNIIIISIILAWLILAVVSIVSLYLFSISGGQ